MGQPDRIASANVQNEAPSRTRSFRRNSASSVIAGNPPPAGSPIPGVVNRKLIVETNSRIDSRLPRTEMRAATGFMARSIAALTSMTPSSAEKAYSGKTL